MGWGQGGGPAWGSPCRPTSAGQRDPGHALSRRSAWQPCEPNCSPQAAPAYNSRAAPAQRTRAGTANWDSKLAGTTQLAPLFGLYNCIMVRVAEIRTQRAHATTLLSRRHTEYQRVPTNLLRPLPISGPEQRRPRRLVSLHTWHWPASAGASGEIPRLNQANAKALRPTRHAAWLSAHLRAYGGAMRTGSTSSSNGSRGGRRSGAENGTARYGIQDVHAPRLSRHCTVLSVRSPCMSACSTGCGACMSCGGGCQLPRAQHLPGSLHAHACHVATGACIPRGSRILHHYITTALHVVTPGCSVARMMTSQESPPATAVRHVMHHLPSPFQPLDGGKAFMKTCNE